jgi:hypothetical protein
MMTVRRLEAIAKAAETEPPMVQVALDGLSAKSEILAQLQTELEKHLRAKEGFQGLVNRIQKVTQFQADRAARIAQTEKTRAVNGGRYANAAREYLDKYAKAKQQHKKRPDLPRFRWVHTNAAKEPRRAHIDLSGQVREVGEDFLPGLKYPGDPDAPPSQTIYCHCYIRRV